MYKGKKYNFIFISVLLIISIFIGCGAVFINNNSVDDSNSGSNNVVVPPDVIIEPDDNNEQENPNPAPVFSSGFQAIEYSLNILNNGEGYTSFLHQTVTATVMMISVEQNIKIKKYRGGGLDFSEEWYYCAASVGENNFKTYFSDGQNLSIRQGENGSYNKTDLTYNPDKTYVIESYSTDYYQNTLGRNKLNNFFQTVNSSTARIIYFDKSDKQNYKVKVSINPDDIDKNYIASFEGNGAKINQFYNMYLTFTINKKTGHLVSVQKEEKINTDYKGLSGEASIIATEFYYNMNKSMEGTIREKISKFN